MTAVEALARLPDLANRNSSGEASDAPPGSVPSAGVIAGHDTRPARIAMKDSLSSLDHDNHLPLGTESTEDGSQQMNERLLHRSAPGSRQETLPGLDKATPSIRISSAAPRSFFPLGDNAIGVTTSSPSENLTLSWGKTDFASQHYPTQPPLPAFETHRLVHTSSNEAPRYARTSTDQVPLRLANPYGESSRMRLGLFDTQLASSSFRVELRLIPVL